MKMKIVVLIVVAMMFVPFHRIALACTVCHSKNPKMVKMHKELEGRNCFGCHVMQGMRKKKSPEELSAQMAADQLCTGCHSAKR